MNSFAASKSPARKMTRIPIKMRRYAASWKTSSHPNTTPSWSPRLRVCIFWLQTPARRCTLRQYLRGNLAAGVNDNQLTSPTKLAPSQSDKPSRCKKKRTTDLIRSSLAQPRVNRRRSGGFPQTCRAIWPRKTEQATQMARSRLDK